MTHTDIKREGWISRLPDKWQLYAILMRLDRPIGWWLLLLPSLWGIALAVDNPLNFKMDHLYLMILFFIGAILMRGAGCIINDLWDRDLDKRVVRTQFRPIASGEISIRKAIICLSILLMFSFLILIQLPIITIFLGLFAVVLIITYPLMKRIIWWPQAFLGVTFNFGVLMGFSAVSQSLSIQAFALYIAAIFWTLGYDTIYALQDKEDDALVGIKSTARLFGKNVKKAVQVFYIISFMFLMTTLFLTQASWWAYLLMLLTVFYFARQVQDIDINNPQIALDIFKSNRDLGILIFLVFIVA